MLNRVTLTITVLAEISIIFFLGAVLFFQTPKPADTQTAKEFGMAGTEAGLDAIAENIEELQPATPSPSPTPTKKPKPSVKIAKIQGTTTVQSTPSPTPTYEIQPQPSPTPGNGSCPVSTQACVPCTAGQTYCRYKEGQSNGYLGWSCQNNNPGNIRYSESRITIITSFGGTAPCGSAGPSSSSQYMVFKTYADGRNAIKAYIKGIAGGAHSAYLPQCMNGQCTLMFFFSKYAPAGDQNDPNSYANTVANQIGVNANTTKLQWIINNKFDPFINAIQLHEGWFTQ